MMIGSGPSGAAPTPPAERQRGVRWAAAARQAGAGRGRRLTARDAEAGVSHGRRGAVLASGVQLVGRRRAAGGGRGAEAAEELQGRQARGARAAHGEGEPGAGAAGAHAAHRALLMRRWSFRPAPSRLRNASSLSSPSAVSPRPRPS